jgi:hypothetical protein
VVLCRSADRRRTGDVQRLAARISRFKKRFDREQVNRRIGRILQHSARAAQRFTVRLTEDGNPAGLRLEVDVNANSPFGSPYRKARLRVN